MITPEDLQNVCFKKAAFGGYVMQDVDSFLESLIADYLSLYRENGKPNSSTRCQRGGDTWESDARVKCKHCDSEWVSKTIVECCPFCGADLHEKAEMDATSPSSVLEFIIEKYGLDVLRERKVLSLFKDLAPGLKEESMLIGIAVDAGTYTEMLSLTSLSEAERKAQLSLCKERLKKQRFLADEFAEKPIAWLSEALGWNTSVPSIYTELEEIEDEVPGEIQALPHSSGAFELNESSFGSVPVSVQDPVELHTDTPFRYRDCIDLANKNGNGALSFTIPSYFDEITENSLKNINSQTLYISHSIKKIHPNAFGNAGRNLKTVLLSTRSTFFAIKEGRIVSKMTGRTVPVPDRISVGTYIQKQ